MCKLKSVIECFIIISLQILYIPFGEAHNIKFGKSRVNVIDVDTKGESVGIKQARTPLKPIIRDVALRYDGYDYMQHCLVEPRFSCKVYAQYAEKISLLSTPTNASSIPKDVFFTFDERLNVIPDNGEFIVNGKECDTNQLICFYGYNEYGFSENSDTILINDLIEDPEILKDLNQATGLDFKKYGVDIKEILDFCVNEIIVKSDSVKELFVYNPCGHCVVSLRGPNDGDRIRITNGFYIIKIILQNECLTKKILL